MTDGGPPVPNRLVVAAAIVDDLTTPRRLLAARRSQPPGLAGRWEFPGGKVEAGESPADALHRELREELGVVVRLGDEEPGPVDGRWPLGSEFTMRLWWAVIVNGQPLPLEDHDELRWLERGTWADIAWLPADVAIVHALAVRAVAGDVARSRVTPAAGEPSKTRRTAT